MIPAEDTLQPFGQAAEFYHQLGWPPLPLPEREKKSPPNGYSGETGIDADLDQIRAWIAENGRRNIGVRMPATVIGIDVDNYGDKTGGADLAMLEAKLGELPATFVSTSRTDGVSGIRFFTVPAGLKWSGNLSRSIEIIQRKHRYAVVEPSMHPEGRQYRWFGPGGQPADRPPTVAELPALPAAWVEFISGGEVDTGPAPRKSTVTPLDTSSVLTPGEPCQAMEKAYAGYAERKMRMARHDAMLETQGRLVRLGEQGHAGAAEAIERLRAQFSADVAGERHGDELGEFQRGLSGAVALVLGSPTPAQDRRCCGRETPPVTVLDTDIRTALDALLADLRTWQDLPDPTHVIVALAAAMTRKAAGEPCWVLLVAPPSSGKTEAVRVLDKVTDAHLDDVTAAGLLGWSKGKDPKPSGVLARIGEKALVTFGDLSTLLATSDAGGRDHVFGLLRKAYDGHVTREISPPGRVNTDQAWLRWFGRLTVVACVTGIIDRYTAHADQLGPRWIYVRIPQRSTQSKRKAAKQARRMGLEEHRRRAREAVATLLASVPEELPELPDAVWDVIEDAALVTAWGRGAVPRNGYGRREIEGVPVIEEPMRLVQQLGVLAQGLLALGLSEDVAAGVARRVAVDSMPEARRAVLETLSEASATGEVLSTSAIARESSLDRKVARMSLEELAAIGVVFNDREHDDGDDQQGTVRWSLKGDDGGLIAQVFNEFRQRPGWDEIMSHTSPSPPREGEEDQMNGGQPYFRPTPEGAPDQGELFDRCQVCGVDLWSPNSQSRGTCERCHLAAARDAAS